MNLTLKTLRTTPQGIFGVMLEPDGTPFCQTLERAYPDAKGNYEPKIDRGKTYICVKRLSPRFKYDVFMLTGVVGHDYIEIHQANWAAQLDGCIGVGDEAEQGCIDDSHDAFNRLMDLQKALDSWELTVL